MLKHKCIKLFRKLLRKHTDTWLQGYEMGFEDGVAGRPMQEVPTADSDPLKQAARCMLAASYVAGYDAGMEGHS